MKRSLLFCLVLMLNLSLFSQVSAPQERRRSPQELQQLSNRYAIEFAAKKTAAEQMALQKGWPVRKEYPDGRIIEIMEISPNGMPEYNTTDNLNAAHTVGANELWPGGSTGLNVSGSGFTLGEWDGGGVRTTHQEFRVGAGPSRVTQKDTPGGTSYHSTHVAGTLIAEGQVTNAHGMAHSANLHAYDWDNDISEMLNANAVDNIILSNHSYGRIRGWSQDGSWYWRGDTVISRNEDYQFGFYGQLTKTWDSLANVMQDYLFVKSAGNDRNDIYSGGHYVWAEGLGTWVWSTWPRQQDGGTDGYDCMENGATAKNLLTVGAVYAIPDGYTGPTDVVMSTFSSWGPTDDGRIKPDIVANGVGLWSTDDDADNDYTMLDGTSMASPNVCGTLALLQNYYHFVMGSYMFADELKALVINTAHEAGPAPGPDYQFGWGLLNAVGAAELIILEDQEGGHIFYELLIDGETDEYIYYCPGTEPVNVTVVWIDPPHTALAPALNPSTYHLVNDVDTRIIRLSDNTTYYPWMKHPSTPAGAAYTGDNYRDNVEKVTIASPVPGHYKITVTPSGGTLASSPQYYAIVISGMHIGVPGKWGGATSTDWNTPSNWEDNTVPTLTTNVTIPASCPNYPVLTGSLGVSYAGTTYLCDNLTINTGGQLTIQGSDLFCAGNIDLDGTMYIGDDATFNNLAVLDLSGSLYTGYNEGWHGLLTMNTGATINQTGGNLYTEEINMASGCQYNGTGGNFRIYKQSYASTQNIQIDDADSYFNYFYINDGATSQLFDCAADLDALSVNIYGTLNLSTYTVTADYANVYDTLTITSGVFDVLLNGPYFQDGSLFTMNGGELNGNESIRFFIGATENVTGGTITLLGDFYDEDEVFSPSGGSFYFEGSDASNINGPTSFYNLIINKTHPGYDAVENGTGDGNGVDISVDNLLQIYDGSFELNSPCTLSVGSYILINENAALNANDAPDVLIRLQGSWKNHNLTGGGFDAGSNSVLELNAPPGSTGVQIVGDNNLFNDIIINSGAPYVRPSVDIGYGLIHARNIDIDEGVLNLLGKKVIVDETLNIYDQLTMTNAADSLIVGDIFWKPGSYDVINTGKILVNGSWTWEDGTNASITSGNLVRFIGNTLGFIYSYDANADFYSLDIDKGSSSVWIHSTSTQPVDVLHNMNVFANSLFHVQNGDLNVNGMLDVQNGATMRLYSGSQVDLDGDCTLNGYVHLSTGGDFYVHGAFQEATTGHINIQSGSFICDKPYFSAKAIQYLYGTLTMSGGTFEITNNHLSLPASFQDNITAGLIRVGGSFIASDNVFQPSGTNTVELINFSSTGNPYVELYTGNWFINLTISGNTTWLIGGSGASTLTVKQDLTINSGALQGGTGDLIYLGDDWINNVGNSGFTAGTSHVYLTGSNPTPDRQTISGTTTFYNVTNQSIVNVIEFAGPVTVSNIYNADAGGSDCATFITGSPVSINSLVLPSGAFSLSASAPVVNVASFDQGGEVSVTNGTLNIDDIVETGLQGSYTIYNGLIDITQDAGSFLDINADINIAGGELRLTGGTDVSYWPISGTHVFTMSGGIMDYKTIGIYLQNNNMTYNITGGVIRTVGPFYSLSGVTVFDPVNNEVELYGTGSAYVNIGTGSWFHDLTINKTGSVVSASRAFPVKGELDVQSGTLNTNNYLITVGP